MTTATPHAPPSEPSSPDPTWWLAEPASEPRGGTIRLDTGRIEWNADGVHILDADGSDRLLDPAKLTVQLSQHIGAEEAPWWTEPWRAPVRERRLAVELRGDDIPGTRVRFVAAVDDERLVAGLPSLGGSGLHAEAGDLVDLVTALRGRGVAIAEWRDTTAVDDDQDRASGDGAFAERRRRRLERAAFALRSAVGLAAAAGLEHIGLLAGIPPTSSDWPAIVVVGTLTLLLLSGALVVDRVLDRVAPDWRERRVAASPLPQPIAPGLAAGVGIFATWASLSAFTVASVTSVAVLSVFMWLLSALAPRMGNRKASRGWLRRLPAATVPVWIPWLVPAALLVGGLVVVDTDPDLRPTRLFALTSIKTLVIGGYATLVFWTGALCLWQLRSPKLWRWMWGDFWFLPKFLVVLYGLLFLWGAGSGAPMIVCLFAALAGYGHWTLALLSGALVGLVYGTGLGWVSGWRA